MERTKYSTTGSLRTETPRIETPFGTLAYSQYLQFGDYGALDLGYFEPPYDGQPGAERTITVNNVEYQGSIYVYLGRDKEMRLSFQSLHRVGDWRNPPTAAAQRKLERELLPLAKELFPVPTEANIRQAIFEAMERSAYSEASSVIHKTRSDVYRDSRYAGFSDDIRAGIVAGLDRAKVEVAKERFEVQPY